MYTFFVLGLIPGTTIQITFQMWLEFFAGLIGFVLLCMMAIKTYRFFKLTNTLLQDHRQPRLNLYATQLHLRVQ